MNKKTWKKLQRAAGALTAAALILTLSGTALLLQACSGGSAGSAGSQAPAAGSTAGADSARAVSTAQADAAQIAESEQTQETEEPAEQKTLVISDEGYDSLTYFNSEYLIAQDGDTYFFVRYDGDGNLEIAEDGFFDKNIPNRFSNVIPNQHEGAVILAYTASDGKKYHAVFANDFSLIGNADHEVTAYRDGLVFANDTLADTGEAILKVYAKDEGQDKFFSIWFNQGTTDVLGSSYGMFVRGSASYFLDIESYTVFKESAEVKRSMLAGNGTEDAETVPVRHGDKAVRLNNNLPNKNGWISAVYGDVIAEGEGRARFEPIANGHYNLRTGSFVESPKDVHSCSYVVEDNGCNICTAIGDRALLCVETLDEDKSVYRIFDLNTGDYVSDGKYLSAELGYHDLLLVQNTEEQWGYIRNDDLSETGEWFTDATSFCNGYAIVNRDGQAYLVDEALRQVSEPFASESAYAAADHFTFSDLNGRAVFFARIDGKVHLVQVR